MLLHSLPSAAMPSFALLQGKAGLKASLRQEIYLPALVSGSRMRPHDGIPILCRCAPRTGFLTR